MPHVEVGLADGTKLVIEDGDEEGILNTIVNQRPAVALNTRTGVYRVLPEQVVYVRYLPQAD